MGKGANRRNRRREQPKSKSQKVQLVPQLSATKIPYIIGAEFGGYGETIAELQSVIDKTPKSDIKRRVLFICEASYLRTGFSTYLHEVFTRLHKTGKYELAELGSYGDAPHIDPRAADIKWKYYHCLPTSNEEAQEYGMVNGRVCGEQYTENQFGRWKLPAVLVDFRPDIVISIRDNWMDRYVQDVALRDFFHWVWMPTVDGYPQKWEWLQDYNKVDTICTYSWFGKEVLEAQSRTPMAQIQHIRPINVKQVCQPGADTEIFKPLPKEEVRKIFGIPEKGPGGNPLRFVGTVMRNQPRKLFPRILEAFQEFKEKYPAISTDVMLLLHTSVPDVGWRIPEIAAQCGVQDCVVYSYMCLNCGNVAISNFIGSPCTCPVCKKEQAFGTPNTKYGFDPQHLNLIYNLMDVYVQGSIAEGDGMPVNEAKMAGVPCIISDYSALAEKARNGGALPIKNDTIYTEHETHQWRSLFDRSDLVKKLAILLGNEPKRKIMAEEGRKCALAYYNWELCAKKWESMLDTIPIRDRKETWEQDVASMKEPSLDSPAESLSDEDAVEWMYKNILLRKGADPAGLHYWCQLLADKKIDRKALESHFRGMIEKENNVKRMLQGKPGSMSNGPMDNVRDIILKNEGKV